MPKREMKLLIQDQEDLIKKLREENKQIKLSKHLALDKWEEYYDLYVKELKKNVILLHEKKHSKQQMLFIDFVVYTIICIAYIAVPLSIYFFIYLYITK